VAEGARLESVFGGNSNVGSNPTLSASLRRRLRMAGHPSDYSTRIARPSVAMWYVYILLSKTDGKLYVGSTDNLKRRLSEHQQGRCESTRTRRPLGLQAYIAVKEEATARELEKYFKSGSGIATLRKRILTSEVRRT
jgi:putative endonuclease